ncbi:hypothetical protein SeLEV6574_g05707 [Synchytrium endobioticum]|nr:hypothetical protein SeLEV6574_g05707 [Synchytrium endobioticum]
MAAEQPASGVYLKGTQQLQTRATSTRADRTPAFTFGAGTLPHEMSHKMNGHDQATPPSKETTNPNGITSTAPLSPSSQSQTSSSSSRKTTTTTTTTTITTTTSPRLTRSASKKQKQFLIDSNSSTTTSANGVPFASTSASSSAILTTDDNTDHETLTRLVRNNILKSTTPGTTSAVRLPKKQSFKPRLSRLDRETFEIENNPMKGFFVLFWISTFFYGTTTMWKSYAEEAISDFAMVSSCFMAVCIQRAILVFRFNRKIGYILQHVWQAAFLGVAIFWVFYRNWPWVQSGFFVLHAITMLMKMHSYLDYNRELGYKYNLRQRLRMERDSAVGQSKRTDEGADMSDSLAFVDRQLAELDAELDKPNVSYPQNVNVMNFIDYMLIPTLVYELEYPRTQKIRPLYVLEKSLATLGTFSLLYITVEYYVNPVLHKMPTLTFVDALIQLLLPFMVCYLLIFYIIFECICNAFAELTRFADRGFYEDWWNSTTFDEFARKWNHPVHEFLLRHVYLESITTYKLSKNSATLLTFFMSSCLHELVLVVVGKRIRMYLFALQMLQIPLIYLGRIPAVRKQKTLGNVLFWVSMFLGPPLLTVGYCVEHYR